MRYQVIAGSKSGHCCFAATVVDTAMTYNDEIYTEVICECFSMEDAQLICDALNAIRPSP